MCHFYSDEFIVHIHKLDISEYMPGRAGKFYATLKSYVTVFSSHVFIFKKDLAADIIELKRSLLARHIYKRKLKIFSLPVHVLNRGKKLFQNAQADAIGPLPVFSFGCFSSPSALNT